MKQKINNNYLKYDAKLKVSLEEETTVRYLLRRYNHLN